MNTYLYRTNENPPTEDLVALIDAVSDRVRNGEKEIAVIHRAAKSQTPTFQPYCVIEAVPTKRGRVVAPPRFLIED
jgi:hypothetical protein